MHLHFKELQQNVIPVFWEKKKHLQDNPHSFLKGDSVLYHIVIISL